MKNFISTHEDRMATLDEIISYFHEYKVYLVSEYMTSPSAVRDVYVVNNDNEVVAYFIEWDSDPDSEPCVYLLEKSPALNFDDALDEYDKYGFNIDVHRIRH